MFWRIECSGGFILHEEQNVLERTNVLGYNVILCVSNDPAVRAPARRSNPKTEIKINLIQ